MNNKEFIRKTLLDKRVTISDAESEIACKVITQHFLAEFGNANVFLFYYPIKREVDTLLLIEYLYNNGKKIYLPCVVDDNLVFKLFEGFNSMVTGKFGVCEPRGHVLDKQADVAVVPAVAFDESCYRLGYGKGFYDRYFASAPTCLRVGLAYDFQIVENLAAEEFDIPVDMIITERRFIRRNTWT